MRRNVLLIAPSALLYLAGCHSPYIHAVISDHGPQTIHLIEVDYPSASFGTQQLRPGQTFRYPFKIIGSAPATIQWTDDKGHDHKSTGPTLYQGNEGTLSIDFDASGTPTWSLKLTGH